MSRGDIFSICEAMRNVEKQGPLSGNVDGRDGRDIRIGHIGETSHNIFSIRNAILQAERRGDFSANVDGRSNATNAAIGEMKHRASEIIQKGTMGGNNDGYFFSEYVKDQERNKCRERGIKIYHERGYGNIIVCILAFNQMTGNSEIEAALGETMMKKCVDMRNEIAMELLHRELRECEYERLYRDKLNKEEELRDYWRRHRSERDGK